MPTGPVKANLNVGEPATEKLVDAVLDTFSPATEALGLLGDTVRLARIEMAVAVTRRAQSIATEAGLTLKAPPLKFLIPFFEKASTEDTNDDTLMEMWSRLLVSAGSAYDARQLRYSTLLAEMGGPQARVLQAMTSNFDGLLGKDADQDALFYNFVESRLISNLKQIDKKNPDDIFKSVLQRIGLPGASVVLIALETKQGAAHWDWDNDKVYSDDSSIDFEILKSTGLIDRVSTDFIEIKHAYLSIILYHISEMGFDFWVSCSGDGALRDTNKE